MQIGGIGGFQFSAQQEIPFDGHPRIDYGHQVSRTLCPEVLARLRKKSI
jgi:hypothetical protein